MSAGAFFFAICCIACLAGALVTVTAANPVRGAMGLLLTIVGIAGLFLKLNAQFLAAIQLIVYAGAVVVLFVFVIMLLGSDAGAESTSVRSQAAKAIGGGLMAIMLGSVALVVQPRTGALTPFEPVAPDHGSVEAVGGLLFSKGIVPFELATLLLIVAVVGAIAVARGKQGIKDRPPVATDPRDLFSGSADSRDSAGRFDGDEVPR